MNEYIYVIKESGLFTGIDDEDIQKLLRCLNTKVVRYKKGEIIMLAGNKPSDIGLVLSGRIEASKEEYSGNLNVIARMHEGEIFADALVSSKDHLSPVTVTALSDCIILFIQYEKIMAGCVNACKCHDMLRSNLLRIIAVKFWELNRKIGYITIRHLRTRLATYLLDCVKDGKNNTIILPFDRASLSGYLNADRSALSRELSRMKAEGLIDFYKNTFKLLDIEALKKYT